MKRADRARDVFGPSPSRGGELSRFLADEDGQSTTEYVLLIALIILPLAEALRRMKDPLIDLADAMCKLMDGPGV